MQVAWKHFICIFLVLRLWVACCVPVFVSTCTYLVFTKTKGIFRSNVHNVRNGTLFLAYPEFISTIIVLAAYSFKSPIRKS